VKTSVIMAAWVAAVLAIVSTGCDRTSGTTASEVTKSTTGSGVSPERTRTDETLRVVIEPQLATADHDLTAVANDTSVTYTWSVNGHLLEGESRNVLSKALFRRSDTVMIEVALNAQHARAETIIQNSPPRALEVSMGRPLDTLHQGLDLTAMPKGVDADGDEIRWEYQWIRNGEALDTETTAMLRGDRYQRGDRLTVTVTPADGEARGEPYTPGPIVIANGAPEFVSRPAIHTGGAEYVYDVQATDPDGDHVRYRLVTAPAGMTVDSETGRIRWPLKGVAPGRQAVEITVDDGLGGSASQPFELDIAPPEAL
jgi:hypothetical protein